MSHTLPPLNDGRSPEGRGSYAPDLALSQWVGRAILPLEPNLRAWLQRRVPRHSDVEDVVQECYCQIARLADFRAIVDPRAYLFTVARNQLIAQVRRERIVRFEALSDIDLAAFASDTPSQEREVAARQELDRVRAAIATLPERTRTILIRRRIEGLSQKMIAKTMGISENVVENESSRGLRAVLALLSSRPDPASHSPSHERDMKDRPRG